MRILVLNPNTSAALTDSIHDGASRAARDGVEVVTLASAWGPTTVESQVDEHLATVGMLENIRRHGGDFDAVVIACFGDPGLYAARELSPVPVIGIAEAAMHMACLVAHQFSIVTILDRMRPGLQHLIAFHGLQARCASIRTTTLGVLDLITDPAASDTLVEAAREAIAHDGAEAIVLGCSGMSGLESAVREALDVPVLDGVACAVKLAEGLVDAGLSTSRRAAFMPPAPASLDLLARR